MGHISNSKGLRLGVSVDWPILYNVNLNNLNQHVIFTSINSYLEKFFSNKLFEKKGFLFLNIFIKPCFSSSSYQVTIFYIDTRLLDTYKPSKEVFNDLSNLVNISFNKSLADLLTLNLSALWGKNAPVFDFNFVPLNFNNINSLFLVKFLSRKLLQRFSLNEVLRNIINNLRLKVYNKALKSPLLGYRFSCNGRFTRKQRATFLWERFGRLSLNTLDATVDYCFLPIKLKNGICGLKFWIFLDWDRYNINKNLSRLRVRDQYSSYFNLENLKFYYNKNVIKAK